MFLCNPISHINFTKTVLIQCIPSTTFRIYSQRGHPYSVVLGMFLQSKIPKPAANLKTHVTVNQGSPNQRDQSCEGSYHKALSMKLELNSPGRVGGGAGEGAFIPPTSPSKQSPLLRVTGFEKTKGSLAVVVVLLFCFVFWGVV